MSFADRIKDCGYELLTPPTAKGAYLPVRKIGNIIFTSGTGSNVNGVRINTGTVGKDITLEQAQVSAKYAILNNIANLYNYLGEDIEKIKVLKLTGYVASSPDFHEQAKVVDTASKILFDIFGEQGRHARSAIGVASLPFNLSVEIEMIVSVE